MKIYLCRGINSLLLLLALYGFAVSARAQQAALLPFQGQLTDQAGAPLTPTAPLTLAFRLYETPVGGAVFWEEEHPNIAVIAGRFSVLLGSRTPFSESNVKMFQKTVYLGITVDDGDPATADVEMRPRQALVPTVFAVNAGDAAKLNGHDWADLLVSGNDPSVGLIRAAKIEPRLLEKLEKRVADLEKTLSSLSESTRLDQPVGTIVTSYLTWDEFSSATQNNATDPAHAYWSAASSKWAPADGRSVAGSKFAAATGQPDVPDLRGIFLRGLNSFDPAHEPKPVDSGRKDVEDRTRGKYQPDVFKEHNHGGGVHSHDTGLFRGAATDWGGPVFRTEANNNSGKIPDSEKIIKTEGGAETRPKNVAIYYYIRIN